MRLSARTAAFARGAAIGRCCALAVALAAMGTPPATAQMAPMQGAGDPSAPDEERRIPGQPPPVPPPPELGNPNAVPPPQLSPTDDFIPVPDRWRLLDALGRKENLFDPYNTNTLKGDKPIFGNDWFFELGAISDTVYEPARVPTPVAPQQGARPGSNSVFGQYGRTLVSQTGILSLSLIKGDTTFKPPDFEFNITPVFNFNHTDVEELGVVNVNPARGTTRDDSFPALQQAFVDYHLRNVDERYDFDSIRVGIQPFSTDFRGFLFQDSQLGVRLFGNRDNNRWQYNLAYFRRLEKDTNSGLNDVGKQLRKDDVFIANLYRQDLPVSGFTSQITYVRNDNHEGGEVYYNSNGFLVRPLPAGNFQGYNYDVNYLGYNGDGHFGRFNLTLSTYWALGHQSANEFSTTSTQTPQLIDAFFFAAEPSIDFDWFRVRASMLYASGDGNPQGGRATGFDAIDENPLFAGADSSYWIRQGIPLIGGGGVSLTQPNGILADLRSSKDEGQSNFTNPGLELLGVGADFDVLPELRVSGNLNYLRFVNTATLEFLRHQSNIPNSIGYDMSVAFTYRPLDTQNVVLRLSGSVLAPGDGLTALYRTGDSTPVSGGNFLYSVLFNVVLTY
ncbi:MAG TPA: hypothetical protein VMU87_16675 [Stellaceae bacterium]|nr:hypothetical protein [Stellaceae bacterium]